MMKVKIGDFLIWEKDGSGEASYSYLDDTVSRISKKNVPIINVIIENSIKLGNSITSTEIADELDVRKIDGYDSGTIIKTLQRIRKSDCHWAEAIESSPRGYRIKFNRLGEQGNDTNTSIEGSLTETKASEELVAKPKSTETKDKISSTVTERTATYLSNFLKNKGRTRTYYYETTLHDVSEVFYPITLTNKDDNSDVDINMSSLFDNNERHRYIISGQIGTGKSLLARKLAVEAASKYSEYGIIPLLFDLNMFYETDESLFDLLKKEYQSYIPDDEPNLAETMASLVGHSDFLNYCKKGSLLLLLDGLDEIPSELKESFLTKLNDFLRSYGNNTIIIFSRPTGKFLEFESFNVLHIKLLSEKQVSEMIDQFVGPYDRKEKEIFKKNVLERYNYLLWANELFANPLFLSILSSKFRKLPYHYQNISLRFSIEDFIRYVTCEDQSNQHPRPIKRGDVSLMLRDELSLFCNYLVTNNIVSFDVDVVAEYQLKTGIYQGPAEDFIDDMCKAYGLIKFVDGQYTFIDDLIVEYFYSKYVFENDNYLTSVTSTLEQSRYYSRDNILDILFDLNKKYMAENIYCPFMNKYSCGEKSYEKFLIDLFHKLHYYVGEGDYRINNYPDNAIYQHLVKKLNIEQDKSHLQFPAIEKYKRRPVYKLSKANAKKLGKDEGLIEGIYCDKKILSSLKIKPVGYIYEINVHNAIYGHDEESETIKGILMSDDFPLRIEYNQALLVCGNIEDGECDL